MLHLALQSSQELSSLAEDGEVEVVVVVSDADLPRGSETNSNREVRHSFTSNMTKVVSFVVEHLDTVSSVVADEDLHVVVDHNTIGELEDLRAVELVEDVANHVKDDNPHDLALHHDDSATVVGGDSARMLENVGTKLPDELTELGEYLNLRK